ETNPEGMQPAMAQHDALLRREVITHRGEVVKMTGDGICAAFVDPLDAVRTALAIQLTLDDPAAIAGVELRVRCGIHLGVVERRDNDYFGNPVNRAARVMNAAHGGQVLITQAVVDLIAGRLPAEVSLLDLGGIRLRDLAGVEHLYQLVHPKLRRDFPALRSLAATPNNLPQQVTSFVGREPELAQAKEMLESARLLTLCGAGGIGKTRLSLELAAGVLDDFPDGVSLVELAPLTDGRLVPQAVASALGVKESAGHSIAEALVTHVAERNMLLILDNCEHLLDSCAELATELLQKSRTLRIVASSRERLHVPGEVVYSVPSLNVPEANGSVEISTLSAYEAVRLFVERAAAATGSFTLDEKNRNAVVQICRQLDGIPLAIELAAARTRALSVDTIAARIGDRFRLLTSGIRTALPRQQTLRALIDWSYDLLRDDERILFRRLSVFAGSFTLEAAESVGHGGGVEKQDVIDRISDLVEKSLILSDRDGARYRMLETMRSYAHERLSEAGEVESVRAGHVELCVSLAEEAAPKLSTPQQATWLARLDADRENLIAAHGYCESLPDGAATACRLAIAMKLYWFARGLLNLGHRLTEVAVAIPASADQSLVRCRALWVAGQISSYMGHYDEAQVHLRESLRIAEQHNDHRMIAAVENVFSLAALGLGDRKSARLHCERGLNIARSSGSQRAIAVGSNALAQLLRLEGELEDAAALYEQAIALARSLDDQEFVAIGLLGLAMAEIGRGDVQRSSRLLREALNIALATGSQPAQLSAVEVSAGNAALRRDFERCAVLFGAAEMQTQRTGIRRDPADDAFVASWIDEARQRLGSRFAELEIQGRSLPFETTLSELDGWLSSAAELER
ncbi:MAG TPA: AAA family ATPase, partial [Casimicrobiaceae bacterium]|nr:AAA family ATPase [Casimicrobiaceae bacterium]